MTRGLNHDGRGARVSFPLEFDFRNRLFRPDVPPSPRPVIQTAAHCVPPDKFPLLLSCPFPPRRFSPPRGITDYFVRPRSPFPPSFPPVDKDRDICDRSSDTARRTPPQYFASTSLPVSRVSTVSPLVFFFSTLARHRDYCRFPIPRAYVCFAHTAALQRAGCAVPSV